MQSEPDAFFTNLASQPELAREVSAQAFAKARKQVAAAAFSRLSNHFLTLVDAQFGLPHADLQLTLFGKTRDGKRFVRHKVEAKGLAV